MFCDDAATARRVPQVRHGDFSLMWFDSGLPLRRSVAKIEYFGEQPVSKSCAIGCRTFELEALRETYYCDGRDPTIPMEDTPAWLKKMEHGAIGEARAKAFLLDRFWVLERSVDIHGADYLIQRQIRQSNFLDRESPRLGIVQVKFIQDRDTSIYIDREYVLDSSGDPYDEFFVLVLSGKEDDESAFLLSGREVAACPTKKGEPNLYRVSGKRLLEEGAFRITNKKRALDRIEHALKNADFLKNRRFLSASSYFKPSPDNIDHDYLLPLDNGYADIRQSFFEEKEKLQSTLFELEELTEAMQEILRSTDPEVAQRVFEEKIGDYLGRGGLGTEIQVRCEAFDDEDFLTAVKNHKQRLAKLWELGLTDAYFDLMKVVEREVVSHVSALGAVDENDVVSVTVEYDDHLSNPVVRVKRATDKRPHLHKVQKSRLGKHTILLKPWDWLSWEVRTGKEEAPSTTEDISRAFAKVPWQFRRRFQKEIDRHLLGEGLVSPFA